MEDDDQLNPRHRMTACCLATCASLARTGRAVSHTMRAIFALLTAAIVATSQGQALGAGTPQAVEIPQKQGGHLKALLFRPEGAGPFPAIVGLHNCTGLNNTAGTPGTRYQDWGQRLVKDGFALLLPDSNGSRGIGSQCAARARAIRTDRERVADAEAARAWLQTQSWVAADRVSLMGWSSGASATLWTVRARPQADNAGGPDFRSAVALYPGCRRLGNVAWSARVPTLILIGRADDQASATACQQMVAGAKGRSAAVAIHVYPGAHHDFDHPGRPLQVRTGLAYSVDGSGRVHSGTNPAARADALKRVPAWFEK
jgi:dienelactone hydrolase